MNICAKNTINPEKKLKRRETELIAEKSITKSGVFLLKDGLIVPKFKLVDNLAEKTPPTFPLSVIIMGYSITIQGSLRKDSNWRKTISPAMSPPKSVE